MAYPFPVSPDALCKEACALGLTPVQFESLIGLPILYNSNIHNFEARTSIPAAASVQSPNISACQGTFTPQDFSMLASNSRAQLIDGYILAEHTVSLNHQAIITELLYQIISYLKATHSSLKVISSPIHLSLPDPGSDILLPDLALIHHPDCINERTVKATPLFAAEVLSSSTYCLDTIKKKTLYQQCGVQEYWIINPEAQHVRSYRFASTSSVLIDDYDFGSKIPVHVVDNLCLNFYKFNHHP